MTEPAHTDNDASISNPFSDLPYQGMRDDATCAEQADLEQGDFDGEVIFGVNTQLHNTMRIRCGF